MDSKDTPPKKVIELHKLDCFEIVLCILVKAFEIWTITSFVISMLNSLQNTSILDGFLDDFNRFLF